MTNNKKHKVSLEKTYATSVEVILNFFKNNTVFKLTGADEIQSDFNTGKLFCLTFNNRGIIRGRFIKITANEIILEWNVEGFQRPSEIKTIVEIILRQEGDRCILKLDHKNITYAEAADGKRKAWTEILEDIKKHINNNSIL